MSKKLLIDAPEWNGINCDSEASPMLENMGTPKKTCDMRNVSGMFPPAFNQLRIILFLEHTDLWKECGGMMIYNHDMFFEFMNTHLENLMIIIPMPDMGMQQCCEIWLRALESYPKSYRRN